MPSALDKKLSSFLRPLVGLEAVVRVSQFPNTACIGLHYMMAHSKGANPLARVDVPVGRIMLADWNHVKETVMRDVPNMSGVYVLYTTKASADLLRKRPIGGRFIQSIPISRFRPRYAFLAATERATQTIRRGNGKLDRTSFDHAIANNWVIRVCTDVPEQAKALVSELRLPAESVQYVGEKWPLNLHTGEKALTLLYYGATCTTYMRLHPTMFLPLEIEDSFIEKADAFETHALYVIPKRLSSAAGLVRECMLNYHEFLFASASDEKPKGFSAMQVACNDILTRSHPAFGHEVLANAASFQRVLIDHHRPPN